MYQFGDKKLNVPKIYAIGEPQFEGNRNQDFWSVSVFFIGGAVNCLFMTKEDFVRSEIEKLEALINETNK